MELLAVGEECGAGKLAGIFMLTRTAKEGDTLAQEKNKTVAEVEEKPKAAAYKAYNTLLACLTRRGEFGTVKEAIRSTKAFSRMAEKHGIPGILIETSNEMREINNIDESKVAQPIADTKRPINVLTVRKKRKTQHVPA